MNSNIKAFFILQINLGGKVAKRDAKESIFLEITKENGKKVGECVVMSKKCCTFATSKYYCTLLEEINDSVTTY